MNEAEWNKRLKECFHRDGQRKRGVRFPARGLSISGDLDRASLHLTADAVAGNVQADRSAFEGWALVLLYWCGVKKLDLDWDRPEIESDKRSQRGHYQRFLYRVRRFDELMGDIFSVRNPQMLDESEIRSGSRIFLNVPLSKKIEGAYRPDSEAALEAELESGPAGEVLRRKLDIVELVSQFPVGLFTGEGKPTKNGAIFTGGKSAIDLIGLGRDGNIHIFELKTGKNFKVGSISELFLYAMIVRDAMEERFEFAEIGPAAPPSISPEKIKAAKLIEAHLLSTTFHPLVDEGLLGILNAQMKKLAWPVRFDRIDLRHVFAAI